MNTQFEFSKEVKINNNKLYLKSFFTFFLFLALASFAGVLEKEIDFDIKDLSFSKIEGYDLVTLENCFSNIEELGAPFLPKASVSVLIPQNAKITEVEIIYSDSIEIVGNYNIYPTQHPRPFIKGKSFEFVVPNKKIYSKNTPYPEKIIGKAHTGSMGGYKITSLIVYPLQYIPADKKLIFHSNIKIKVTYESKLRSLKGKTEKQNNIFKERVKNLVINPEDIGTFGPSTKLRGWDAVDSAEYVIITVDSFKTAFQELADWKTKKGIPAKVVTIDSIYNEYTGADNAEKVRNFIKDVNSSWGTIWILLGGQCDYEWNQEIVPRRDVWYRNSAVNEYPDEDTIPSDLYFSDLDGNWNADGNDIYGESTDEVDFYSDVFVGRAPVRTVAQAETFVKKVLTYEKKPPSGYQKKILLPAAYLWPGRYDETLSQEAIAEMIPGDWQVSKMYEREGNLTQQAYVDSVRSGFGFSHLVGHGNEHGVYIYYADAYFNSDNLDVLDNDSLLGIHNSMACMSGALDLVPNGDCFAEHYLTPASGGSFSIMNSRYGWGRPPAMGPSEHIDTCFYHEIFREDYTYHNHLGVAHAFSKDGYVSQVSWSSYWAWCIYELNLFGDPEMPLRTDNPKELAVTHDDLIPIGTNTFTVNVTDEGNDIENAYVCLYKEGEVYARGYTNAFGDVIMNLSPAPTSSGEMHCTVTKNNYLPYEGNINVIYATDAWVVFEEYSFEASGTDQNTDPGDSIAINITVHNTGLAEASNVTGILRTDDIYINIIDSLDDFGNILPDSLSTSSGNFSFYVSTECPADHIINFELVTGDQNNNTWTSPFPVPIATPDIFTTPDTLNFDTVFIGYPDTLEVLVQNDGTDTLKVDNITFDNTDYSVDISNFNVNPDESRELRVIFSPSSEGISTGNLTIESNDLDQPALIIFLTGEGLSPPAISVSPDSLSDNLFTGGTSIHTLTISNTGESNLNFVASNASFGPATVDPTSKPLMLESVIPASTSSSLNKNSKQPFLGAGSGKSIYFPAGLILKNDTINVLLLSPDDNISDLETVLSAFSDLDITKFPRIDLPDLNITDLVSYNVVITTNNMQWMENAGVSAAQIGNLLADYIDAGGKVIVNNFAYDWAGWQLEGRFIDEQYGAFTPSTSDVGRTSTLGTIHEPNHPIMADVSTITNQYLRQNQELAPGAIRIADWNDGNIFCAANENVIAFNILPSDGYGNPGWTGDLPTMYHNSILWLTSWLSFESYSGTILPNNSAEIDLTFDATGLYGGDYLTEIIISSNDPANPEINVPAHLHVTGAPDICVSNDTLNQGTVFIGYSAEDTLLIENEGTEILTIDNISSDNLDYSANINNFNLNPGESREVVITFAPSSTGNITGNLTLSSNDPDEPDVDVVLRGECVEPPEISVTPDSVSDSLFTGETSTKILTINNTGVTDLIFSISLEDLGFKPVIIQDSRFSRANIEKQGALSTTNINRTTSRNETNADFRVLSFPKAPPMADIAILGVEDPRYDAYLENVSEYLVNSGRFASVNTINGYATTPTLAELQTYDAVGVFSWRNWGDPDAIGDVLADYIDSGGNVFVAFAANAAAGDLPIGGRFDSENYWLISPNSYSMSNNYSMGTVLEPDHAIMTGVDSLISRSKLNSEALVSKDATILAEFEDGTPLLAIGRKNNSLRTDISFPFITSATNAAGIDATTDAELLIINAFEWLTNPAWLLTELSSDTVPAGGSVNIEVTFDASQLFGGNYYANIIVSSNDPANPELKIPAHLHVTGAPDISIWYDTLSYGIVFNGYSATDTLIIENNGTDLLTVTNILSDNADYNADITNFSLNPGENRKVPVIFTPSSTGVITGTLSIESNDPDNPTSTVLLQGECMEPPDISVSPLSFSKSLETGETAIDTLTIYNNGLSNLIFNLSTEESWVSTRKTSKNVDNAVSSIIQRSGILESEISINSTKEEQGKNIEKVYKKPEEIANTKYNQGLTPFAGTPSVAIVASAGLSRSFTDVQNKLLATGEFFSVTVIDAQIVTPTTEELQAFDAVLVWKNTIYSNRVSLGNNLADYVDAGGGVVLAVYESGGTIDRMLGGRWESEKYYVIARSSAQTGLQNLGAVAIPAHPIMQGVTSFNGGDASSRSTTTSLTDGSTLIASWSDGTPLVATKKIRGAKRVDLGFYPPSSDVGYIYWQTDTDGDILMANALKWAAGPPWISISSTPDTIQVDDSVKLEITFDATGLNGGNYYADIIISSNDPNESTVTTPSHLHVTGIPDIEISTDTLDFGIAYHGFSVIDTLVIANTGTDVLTISSISSDKDDYTIDTTNFALEPSDSQKVPITFSPSTTGTTNGNLNIESNDPDNPTIAVFLRGECVEPPDISVSQDSLIDTLSMGENSTHNLKIYNNGGSELNFDISIANFKEWLSVKDISFETIEYTDDKKNIYVENSQTKTGFETEFSKKVYTKNIPYSVPENILVMEETADSNYYDIALGNLGLSRILVTSWNTLETELSNGTHWDMVIVNSYGNIPPTSALDLLDDYQTNGGLLIYADWAVFQYPSHSLLTSLGIEFVSYFSTPMNFHAVDTEHLLFNKPNNITSFSPTDDQYERDGEIVRVTEGAVQLAYFEGYSDNGAIVRNKKGNCIFNGFQAANFNADNDSDGKIDIVELIENEIMFLSVSWLSADPVSDTIRVNDSLMVTITFDATDLDYGDFFADISITNNDPYKPEIKIPTHLKVADLAGFEKNKLPKVFFVKQNYPNPFNQQTVIRYGCPEKAQVCIQVFDCLGRIVVTLVDKKKEAGYHEVIWDGINKHGKKVANAVYFYRMHTDKDFKETRKMILLK